MAIEPITSKLLRLGFFKVCESFASCYDYQGSDSAFATLSEQKDHAALLGQHLSLLAGMWHKIFLQKLH